MIILTENCIEMSMKLTRFLQSYYTPCFVLNHSSLPGLQESTLRRGDPGISC